MKLASTFAVILLGVVLATTATAQTALPKEGTAATTTYFTGTGKAMPVGADRIELTYEVFGIVVNEAGQGFLHHASARCVGRAHAANRVFDNESGSCSYVDAEGHQAFLTYQ